ncbi:tripeptidyl peptidase A [Crucibulum laeve]|uniref:tripeptidyl-peptidase II n=1 Tax=Crucibulum laeve TaxID=68775 RepID=A0A5C3MFV6_9AGAR|nr:tripeptidyl peptidase A [Crucibulum laeve]
MRVPWCLLATAIASPQVFGAPSIHATTVKETVIPPRSWIKVGDAPPDHNIVLRIGLSQPNFAVLEQHLYEEQVEGLVAPHQESIDLVDGWLASHGLVGADLSRSPAKDWVTVNIPVRLAEKLLDTKYHVWKHAGSGDHIVRTTSYSLPQNLHAHVDVIQPTMIFARWTAMKSTLYWPDAEEEKSFANNLLASKNVVSGSAVDASCNSSITIKCLQQLYNTVGYKPQSADKNAIGITGYLEQFANIQNLQSFYGEQLPEALNSTFKFISVSTGLEANLDVQFAYGLSYPTPGTFWSTAGRPPFKPDLTTPTNTNKPYADWLDYVLLHRNIPQTVSTSYGEAEQTIPESYARRVCAGMAQLGARGVSLLFSSGDGGVGDGNPDPATQECITNDGRNATRFAPVFPASCPYVTAVGGTNNVPEVAVFFSGGGFSDLQAAVASFLKALPKGKYEGLFNSDFTIGMGERFPTAQGRRLRVWWQGRAISIGGTSASAPTFAAVVALLNDARLAKHLPPLGFLNPVLYTFGLSGFNDITEGNNPGCGTPGFNATPGWDPITGLGTPNFQKLKSVLA